MKRALLTVIIGFAMAACGGGGDDGNGGTGGGGAKRSCDVKVQAGHTCVTYTGTAYTDDTIAKACSMTMGGTVASSCPTSGLAGACTQPGASGQEFKTYYYSPVTSDQVKQICSLGGGTFGTKSLAEDDDTDNQ